MFRAVLFITAKKYKQPNFLSINEQKYKMWSIYITGYSARLSAAITGGGLVAKSCLTLAIPLTGATGYYSALKRIN